MATRKPSTQGTKPARRGTSAHAEAKKPGGFTLTPTDVDGVFRNSAGILVDKSGIALSLLRAVQAERADMASVLDGQDVRTPAQFLKAVSLDPRLPLPTRVEAAKAAAPYTDRKMPQGVDGGVGSDGQPLPIHLEIGLPPELMAKLSDTELATFDKILGLLKAHGITPKEGS